MRSLLSAVLAMEAVVIALAIPVATVVNGVDAARAGWVGGALAILCLVVVALLRYPWAIAMGWFVQVAAIASGFVVTPMFFLGAMFAALWFTALRLGRRSTATR